MLNTHERAKPIAEALRRDPELAEGLHLYILLPYMAKYVRAANQKGIVNMLGDMVAQSSFTQMLKIGIGAGAGFLRKEQLSLLRALIELELMPFKGLNVKAVFLHNSLTDLAVALGMKDILAFYAEEISSRHKTQPAFCTLSSAPVMRFLDQSGLKNQLVMAPFNRIGFQMSPSREECERALNETSAEVVAMSVFAAGQMRPAEGAAYIRTLPRIKSVILGASSKSHIEEGFRHFSELAASGSDKC